MIHTTCFTTKAWRYVGMLGSPAFPEVTRILNAKERQLLFPPNHRNHKISEISPTQEHPQIKAISILM